MFIDADGNDLYDRVHRIVNFPKNGISTFSVESEVYRIREGGLDYIPSTFEFRGFRTVGF